MQRITLSKSFIHYKQANMKKQLKKMALVTVLTVALVAGNTMKADAAQGQHWWDIICIICMVGGG